MIAIDTSAWIERLLRTPLALRMAPLFPPLSACVMPTMVQLELAKWVARNGNGTEFRLLMQRTAHCQVVDLDSRIAARAALLHRRLRLATADAVIYATARSHKCRC